MCVPVAVDGHRVLRDKLQRVLEWKERVVRVCMPQAHRNPRFFGFGFALCQFAALFEEANSESDSESEPDDDHDNDENDESDVSLF